MSRERIPTPGGWIALFVLAAVTALVYGGVVDHEFLDYDDPLYVTENPAVKAGVRPGTVVWALTDTRQAHYWHPLTWIAHMVDVEAFGLDAGRHLAVNLGLHILATLLLCWALFAATGRYWESLVVAALFALHPQHVEVVAWVSERKDTLSAVFLFLTLILYVRHARAPSAGRLLATFGSFLFALMAKPSVVTLPAALLLLDYWPLRRAPFSPASNVGTPTFAKTSTLRLVLEKLPLLAIAVAIAATTLIASGASTFPEERLSLPIRFGNAARSTMLYLERIVWPFDLAAFYPHPGVLPLSTTLTSTAILLGLSGGALFFARTRPHLFVGWFWYLGTLSPVSQLIQNARHGMADRYTYIPLIGIFVAIVWEAGIQVRRAHLAPRVVVGATILVLGFFSYVSWSYVGYWQSSETLFRQALTTTTDNYFAHAQIGGVLLRDGRTEEAELHLRETLRLRPNEPNSMNNLGFLLASRGDMREAGALFWKSTRLRPSLEGGWYGLATVAETQGRWPAAERYYRKAVRRNRASTDAHYRLGSVLAAQGKMSAARESYERVIAIDPGHEEAAAALAGE